MGSHVDNSKEEFFAPTGPNIIISDGSSFSETLSFSVNEDPLRSPFNGNNSSDDENLERNHSYDDHSSVTSINLNGDSDPRDDENESDVQESNLYLDSSTSEYLRVKVTRPQREYGDKVASLVPGGNIYVSYLIVTHTNIPEYGGTDFKVRRRFRDFVALSELLAQSYRGFFIPPRPDKNIVESQVMQKNEFIEQRRKALERYLGRLSAHPIMRTSKELMQFLQIQENFSSHVDVRSRLSEASLSKSITHSRSQDTHSPKVSQGLVTMWKELKRYVANDAGVRPAITEEDNEFLKQKAKLQELEQNLNQASQEAELLIKAEESLGDVMGRVGLAFIKLSKYENQAVSSEAQRVHSADTKQIGTAALKASRSYRETNEQSVKHLDKLQEYLSVMQAVHTAFSDRSDALSTIQSLMSELSSLKSKDECLSSSSSGFYGDTIGNSLKAAESREHIRATQKNLDHATRQYECIKENNRKELRRFETERKSDFLNMMKGFAHCQVANAEKVAKIWESAADDLQGYMSRAAVVPEFP
eukprot:TRINITY_DN10491_c0_g2_i1.p1 TRINITY_DN10491_c0_g2~~TRINITY_DN10491_c0_g2_i1.p1  ORF type:complete len:531 (-),score=130.03 TRINITY_DN10491_c0_g2_i1:46-1638(-)